MNIPLHFFSPIVPAKELLPCAGEMIFRKRLSKIGLQRLLKLQEEIYIKQRQTFLGQTVEVLVEKRNFKDDRFLKGKTRCWKNVLFAGGDELIGTIQNVHIHSYSHQTLMGDLISTPYAKTA